MKTECHRVLLPSIFVDNLSARGPVCERLSIYDAHLHSFAEFLVAASYSSLSSSSASRSHSKSLSNSLHFLFRCLFFIPSPSQFLLAIPSSAFCLPFLSLNSSPRLCHYALLFLSHRLHLLFQTLCPTVASSSPFYLMAPPHSSLQSVFDDFPVAIVLLLVSTPISCYSMLCPPPPPPHLDVLARDLTI